MGDEDDEGLNIVTMGPEDIKAIAELVTELGAMPETHCIHSWAGESPEEVVRELCSTLDDGELVYVLARSDGRLEGAMGCEFDRELGRGWLQGPHVRMERTAVAAQLFDALRSEIPDGIVEFDAFVNEANAEARRFYLDRGFHERDVRFHEYQMARDRYLAGPVGEHATSTEAVDATVPVILIPAHHPTFFPLFDTLFPNAYYDHDRLLEMQGDSHQILVVAEDDSVTGFVVVYHAPGGHRGEIQFLGVREDRREEGLGRQLLLAGVNWLGQAAVHVISLNVEETRTGARRLYQSVGFELRYTGVALKRRGRATVGAEGGVD